MKSKVDVKASGSADGLLFAWSQGDEAAVRLGLSILMALVLFVGAGLLLRVIVPASVVVDPPRVSSSQLIMVGPESHPSLKAILEAGHLPSLGMEESVADVPLVGEMLALLGLEEEEREVIELYPAPELAPELGWPSEEKEGLTLLPLDAISEESWPTVLGAGEGWTLAFSAEGELGELFKGEAFPWVGGEPMKREFLWSLAFDADGALAFASAIENLDTESEREIRRVLEGFFEEARSFQGDSPVLVKAIIKEKKG